jgi:hypothetical protein
MADDPHPLTFVSPAWAACLRALTRPPKPTAAQRRQIRRLDHWHAQAAGDLARLGASRDDLAALARIAAKLRLQAVATG